MTDHRAAQDQITEWLLAKLASSPQSAATLRESAEAAGHSWRGLQRAAVRLQVERTKIGMAYGWMWSLPAPAAEGAISNGIFGASPAVPVVEAVTCLAAYGYEVPNDGLMHGVPTRE
jgi:putative DNA primase/helicase